MTFALALEMAGHGWLCVRVASLSSATAEIRAASCFAAPRIFVPLVALNFARVRYKMLRDMRGQDFS